MKTPKGSTRERVPTKAGGVPDRADAKGIREEWRRNECKRQVCFSFGFEKPEREKEREREGEGRERGIVGEGEKRAHKKEKGRKNFFAVVARTSFDGRGNRLVLSLAARPRLAAFLAAPLAARCVLCRASAKRAGRENEKKEKKRRILGFSNLDAPTNNFPFPRLLSSPASFSSFHEERLEAEAVAIAPG